MMLMRKPKYKSTRVQDCMGLRWIRKERVAPTKATSKSTQLLSMKKPIAHIANHPMESSMESSVMESKKMVASVIHYLFTTQKQ